MKQLSNLSGVSERAGQHEEICKKRTGNIGSSFDGFLKQHGTYEDVTARHQARPGPATRRPDETGRNLEEISKTELASRMHTSRAQLDRLLDPDNESVTLGTLARVAKAVGRNLRVELV